MMHERDKPQNLPSQQKPLTVTVPEACALSGLSATTLWKLIADERLEVVRLPGTRRTLVIFGSLERLLTPAYSSPAAQRKGRARPAETVSPIKSSMEVA
jgi:predicted DNA-binding transcriptional regulator AlpA